MKLNVSCKNLYTVRKIHADGNEETLASFHNMPLQGFYDVISGFFGNNSVHSCWFGTGSTPPTPADTKLEQPLWTCDWSNYNIVAWEKYINDEHHICYKYTFKVNADSQHVGSFSEIGIYVLHGSYSLSIATRALVRDSSGNPITISKTDLEAILVDAVFEFILEDGNGFKWRIEDIYYDGQQSGTSNAPIFSLNMFRYCCFLTELNDDGYSSILAMNRHTSERLSPGYYTRVYSDDHRTITTLSNRLMQSAIPSQRYIKAIGFSASDNNSITYSHSIIGSWEFPNASVIPPKKLTGIPVGIGDGSTTEFTAPLAEWMDGTDEVYVNDVLQVRGVDYVCDCRPNALNLPECSVFHGMKCLNDVREIACSRIVPILGRPPIRHNKYLWPVWDPSNPVITFAFPEDDVKAVKRIVIQNLGVTDTKYNYVSTNLQNGTFTVEYSYDEDEWHTAGSNTILDSNAIVWDLILDSLISARYWRFTLLYNGPYSAGIYAATDFNSIIAYGEQTPITFMTPPPVDAVITMNASVDCPMKNENFILDVNPTFAI